MDNSVILTVVLKLRSRFTIILIEHQSDESLTLRFSLQSVFNYVLYTNISVLSEYLTRSFCHKWFASRHVTTLWYCKYLILVYNEKINKWKPNSSLRLQGCAVRRVVGRTRIQSICFFHCIVSSLRFIKRKLHQPTLYS